MNRLKIALVLIPVLVPMHWYLLRYVQIASLTDRCLYAAAFVACALATVLAAFARSTVLRLGYACAAAVALALSYVYLAIVADFMSYDAFIRMVEARAFIGDAFGQFLASFAAPALASVLLFAGIALAPRRRGRSRWLERGAALLPAVAVLGVATLVYARGGHGAIGLPGSIVPLSYAMLYGIEVARAERGARAQVDLSYDTGEPDYDVVLVVDESIRGDFLDVGGATGVTSHLLDGNPAVHDYGLGAAATNCSDPSNTILRYGGTRENYLHTTNTQPSVFHYAKHRGLRTVYLDGQRTGRRLQNGMSGYELAVIDEFVQLDGVAVLERDGRIAELLVERTRNGVAEFILVNKVGAHFPVNDKYPDAYLRYEPALERGSFRSVSDTGARGAGLSWERYRNSYRNTLLWNVGAFFEVLLGGADLRHAFIVYTSDHGQDFGEKDAGFNLHCSPDPSPFEGLVPMTVITDTPAWSSAAARGARSNYDGSSHYNVFPTLLEVMGYADPRRRDRYGPSLLEQTDDPLTFNYSYEARFGVPAKWRRVEIAR